MTYREIMQRLHPDQCGPSYIGGCFGCPGDILDGAPMQYGDGCENGVYPDPVVCRRCWNTELAPLKEKA